VLAGALAWGIVRATATARSWTSLGAAAGLVAIVVHDLVDFALEMAGVAVVAAALLAAVVAPRRSAARTERGVRARHAGALAATLALIATALLGPRLDAESTHALTAQLVRLAKSGDRESFEATLRQALRLHPAEPVFPLLAGAAAVRDDDDRALRWLNRAMVLAPGWASPHVETARLLAQRGRLTQAFLELREAETRHAGSGTALACTILEQRPHAAPELVRIAGAGPFADDLLDRIARCLPLEHEASTIVDAHLVERGSIGARTRNASRLLAAGDARAALEALESLRTPDTDAQLVRASALLALGEHREALHVLDRAEALADRPEEVLALRARVQAAAGDVEGMRTTMRRIRGRAGGRARALAAAWITEGGLEQSLGNTGAALSAYQRAHRLDPDSAGLARSAALAESTGDLSRALRAYAELCLRDGRESPHCAARDRVERRLAELPRLPAQPPGTP
jgi:tetratricopeptide (TPR) repeat protein